MRVIPEFESPGHSRAASLDEKFKDVALCSKEVRPSVIPDYGVVKSPPSMVVLDPSKQKTYDLIEAVL